MPGTPAPRAPSTVLRDVERLGAVGAGVSALELLVQRGIHDSDGLLSWRAGRTRHRWMTGRAAPALDRIFGSRGVRLLLLGRVVAAATLVLPVPNRLAAAAADGYLAGTGHLLALRSPYGSDGAESLTTLAMTTAALGRSAPSAQGPAVAFLGAQSMLSYLIAGLAKLASPTWMDGTAIRDVFRTRIFGERRLFAFVRDRPRLRLLIGRSVAIGETVVPLALLLRPRHRRIVLTLLTLFHAGTAVVMGLNRFPWAFMATYPAVQSIGRR